MYSYHVNKHIRETIAEDSRLIDRSKELEIKSESILNKVGDGFEVEFKINL